MTLARFCDRVAITIILLCLLSKCSVSSPAYADLYYIYTPAQQSDYIDYDLENIFTEIEWTEINTYEDGLLEFVQDLYKVKLKTPLDVNNFVNKQFPYSFNAFNMWHWQSPAETMLLGNGDCKAKAVFKYHLLRALGYKNVKILVMQLMSGRGTVAGHAVALLNDTWVLDINSPYYYPYAYVINQDAPMAIFDAEGVAEIILPE